MMLDGHEVNETSRIGKHFCKYSKNFTLSTMIKLKSQNPITIILNLLKVTLFEVRDEAMAMVFTIAIRKELAGR
jgi:hypothetical protein